MVALRTYFIAAILKALLLTGLLAGAACAQSERAGARNADHILIIETKDGAEHRFTVEFAQSDEERRVGLMYRTELAPDAGMLFDFGEPQPVSMWMKNTLIPLDMAFIDEHGVIRRIEENTTPRSLASVRSGAPVISVLEVNGGRLRALGVSEGDLVRHPLFNNK